MPQEKDKTEDQEGAEDKIQDAMAEAMASMEAREQGDVEDDDGEGVALDVGDDAPEKPKTTAAGAVTEALIDAKKELETVLEQTQKETTSFREKWLRAAADLENYRKRAVKERDEVQKFGNEKLLKDFLPLIDDIERAVAAVETSEGDSTNQLLDGVKLVHKKFLGQLEKNGVTTFDSLGEVFDPAQHEAVQQIHTDTPQGKVCEQLQRGFMLNDRLLRPAMVVVSLGPAEKSDGEGDE